MSSTTVRQLASLCGGTISGDGERVITGANTLEEAGPADLSFAENEKALRTATASRAGCILVPRGTPQIASSALIAVSNPRLAFAKALGLLYPARAPEPAIHPTAVIARTAVIGRSCSIGPNVVIGENAQIGESCTLMAGCVIGNGVQMGAGSTLHPNVTLYDGVRLGSRVMLHAGCVIGADGFGYTFVDGRFEKFPQVGTVEIGDDVELGANCCIDRAALGTTRIGQGSKLDNLIHVAHNCSIGANVVIAAQAGFSGSVTVGDYAMIGGQAGVGEKAAIDAQSVVGGKAGILTSQRVHAGEPVWGIPARPLKQHLRGLAHVSRLPKTEQEVKDLRKRLNELERQASPEQNR